MSLRTVFLVMVAGLLAIFTVLNWQAFITPTTLSLVFAEVQAPLGLVMLVITGLLAALFLLYVAYLQSTTLLESRRFARELQSQRQLADAAEASRFTELRTVLEERLRHLDAALAETQTVVQGKLDRVQADMRSAVEQSATTLSAYIGEVEDRLERRMSSDAVNPPG
jgi:uncharacterized integral membrane protein